jgi:hypothetical protein
LSAGGAAAPLCACCDACPKYPPPLEFVPCGVALYGDEFALE